MIEATLRFSLFSLLSSLLVLLSGCGGPHAATVSGTVTLDGDALQRGTVTFHPAGEGPLAYGTIDEKGNYTLRTGRETGLAAGEYVVTVVASEPPPSTGFDETPGKLLTPERYGKLETTDLRFTVNRGANRIDLPLTSK